MAIYILMNGSGNFYLNKEVVLCYLQNFLKQAIVYRQDFIFAEAMVLQGGEVSD